MPEFEKKYKIKVTYDFFDNYDTMLAKIGRGGSGYDITFPTGTTSRGFARGRAGPARPLADAEHQEPRRGVAEPGLRPGQRESIPYMWWTTGVAYDTAKVPEKLTSWNALWDPKYSQHIAMLDDQREAFAAALFLLGKDTQHDRRRRPRRGPALLQEQKPLVRGLHDR